MKMEMKFCPNCGNKLDRVKVDNTYVSKCQCGFIDWNNYFFIATVTVCFNEKNEFLMVKLKKPSEENKLTFPGGYRNINETIEESAKRECCEETGLLITDLKLFKTYTRDDMRLIWIVYLAKIASGQFVENDETKEILFFTKDNLPSFEELRGSLTKQLLEDLVIHLKLSQ